MQELERKVVLSENAPFWKLFSHYKPDLGSLNILMISVSAQAKSDKLPILVSLGFHHGLYMWETKEGNRHAFSDDVWCSWVDVSNLTDLKRIMGHYESANV